MRQYKQNYVTIEMNDCVIIKLTEAQLKFLCLISANFEIEHQAIVSLMMRNINEHILKCVSKIIKTRELYNKMGGYQYTAEKEIMNQLSMVAKTIDCFL